MVTATALIVNQKGNPFEMKLVELDALRPHEIMVDIRATGICHMDIAMQQGKSRMSYPMILGHEGAGIVRAIGSQVMEYQPGDHVILSYNYCKSCRSCENEQPYQCYNTRRLNWRGAREDGSQTVSESISTCFFGQSSFCNPAIVQEASCVKIDKSFPLPVVCALGCGFQTGTGSIYNVVKPIERKVRRLAIFGVTDVGCAAIMAANHLRTSSVTAMFDIIAIDIVNSRLELAKEFGATHVINSAQQNLHRTIGEITNGEYLDAVIDYTGSIRAIGEMINLTARGGIAVSVGSPPPGQKIPIDCIDMVNKCKTYCGCQHGNAYSKTFIPWLAELYAKGQFPLEKIQKTYAAMDINYACQDLLSGKVLKPILLWD